MPAYTELDDLEDQAIHLSDITGIIACELRGTHPELVKDLQSVTSKILAVSREKHKVASNG